MTHAALQCTETSCPLGKNPCPGICLYGDVLENINLGILVLDTGKETILFRNSAARALLNENPSLSSYETLVSRLLPDLNAYIGTTGKTPSRELPLGERTYGYTGYTFSTDYMCIFILDITEKVRLESIAEAVDTMNNIGYVFSGVRHEIGNPINSLKTTLAVLRNNIDKFSGDTVVEYIQRAQGEIARIEYLLHSLRNFNMHESPKSHTVKLNAFLDNFLSLITEDLRKKGIEISTKIQSEAGEVFIDPRALQQVLLNLVTNAIDALGRRKKPKITIHVSQAGERSTIRIEDNGCGMSQQQQRDLFKPFHTTKSHGNGLGLVICRKMLAKMNSTITVKSTKNVGTAVEISLPKINVKRTGRVLAC
jgi:signal transduction histidine kinase